MKGGGWAGTPAAAVGTLPGAVFLGSAPDVDNTGGIKRPRWLWVGAALSRPLLSRQENYDDPHKTPASPVVHIRGLIDGVVEADLVEALQEFGPIR